MDHNTWLLVAVLALLIVSNVANSGGANSFRLKRIERRLDLILEQLGVDPNDGVNREVADLIRAGQKIAAIKKYREQTGVGLKEAKDYVEGL